MFVVFQVQGIDSQIFIALAVDSAGKGRRLMWDGDRYGGHRRYMTEAWIHQVPCDHPVLKDDNETVHCSPSAGA